MNYQEVKIKIMEQGYTVGEIAQSIGVRTDTLRRSIELGKRTWEDIEEHIKEARTVSGYNKIMIACYKKGVLFSALAKRLGYKTSGGLRCTLTRKSEKGNALTEEALALIESGQISTSKPKAAPVAEPVKYYSGCKTKKQPKNAILQPLW